jgi:predicted metal-binding membrane protein
MAVIQEEIAPASVAVRLPVARVNAAELGIWLATAGWASMALIWVTGSAGLFGHDQEGVLGLGLFLVGWVAMVAAMMLPSSLPTLRGVTSALVEHGGTAAPRFMAGYFLVWAIFGAAAFAGDGVLHLTVDSVPLLAARPWLIAGGIAIFAGAAEILGRTAPPRLPSAAPGAGPLGLGRAHAVDRIRRCWPLMLFAMAIGMSSPVWMVGLTLVMVLELIPRASAAVRCAGVVVFGMGIAVIAEPAWVPLLLGSG